MENVAMATKMEDAWGIGQTGCLSQYCQISPISTASHIHNNFSNSGASIFCRLQVKNQPQQPLDVTRLFEDMVAFKDMVVFENMAASFFEAEYRGHIICGPPPSTSRPPLKSLIPQSQNVPFEGAEIGKKDVPLVSEEAKKSLISIQCCGLRATVRAKLETIR